MCNMISKEIEKISTYSSSTIIFVIGGSLGMSQELLNYSQDKICFSYFHSPFLICVFEPDVVFQFNLFSFIIVFTRINFNFANFIVSSFEFAGFAGYRMALFNAAVENPDVRLSILANASDYKILIGDITNTGYLVDFTFFIP